MLASAVVAAVKEMPTSVPFSFLASSVGLGMKKSLLVKGTLRRCTSSESDKRICGAGSRTDSCVGRTPSVEWGPLP